MCHSCAGSCPIWIYQVEASIHEWYAFKCCNVVLFGFFMYKALDSGDGKPPELSMKHWEELQRIRQSEESKRKSQQMGNQARKRGLRNTTKEKIKQAVLVKLVSAVTELKCKHLISC